MGSVVWGKEVAENYDDSEANSPPEILDRTTEVLAELADGGRALELAVGTGRVALPLARRGVKVAGIELSPHMAAQLRKKDPNGTIELVMGDMTTAVVPGVFRLVYLVYNTIMNVTTQDEQVAVFTNAARHLEPGGCFLLELVVPQVRAIPPGEHGRVFHMVPDHVGIETHDDPVGQIAWSHHWIAGADGRLIHHAAPYRYIWPSELDLMARLAGLRLRDQWADWSRTPFGPDSWSRISVYEKPAE